MQSGKKSGYRFLAVLRLIDTGEEHSMLSREFSEKKTADTASAIEKLREELAAADAVFIGAGAGLSASAGFVYTGERFHKYFQNFIDKYGFLDIYSGGFCFFDTLEKYWSYWSRTGQLGFPSRSGSAGRKQFK